MATIITTLADLSDANDRGIVKDAALSREQCASEVKRYEELLAGAKDRLAAAEARLKRVLQVYYPAEIGKVEVLETTVDRDEDGAIVGVTATV